MKLRYKTSPEKLLKTKQKTVKKLKLRCQSKHRPEEKEERERVPKLKINNKDGKIKGKKD